MDDFPEKSVSPAESDRPSSTSPGSAWKEGRRQSSPCHVFEEELKEQVRILIEYGVKPPP
jgi:hypothetical protein